MVFHPHNSAHNHYYILFLYLILLFSMISEDKLFVRVLSGKAEKEIPFWFMRQAGRYLPEYRQLRKQAKNFLSFCYTPDMATEATLQPIQRFGMSAAIIFSDILVIPHALGMEVWFEEGRGPRLTPLIEEKGLSQLSLAALPEKLAPVYQAISSTRAALPSDTALIGFCGSPWTLACYAIEGGGSRDFQDVRLCALQSPVFFSALMDILQKAVVEHASLQVQAGAEVIQLFDSWAGVLSAAQFDRWVIEPTKYIVSELKKRHPQIPIIGFPRLAGTRYGDYAKHTGVDAISIDSSLSPEYIAAELKPHVIVQGNLDNLLLASDKAQMLVEAKKLIDNLRGGRFIFNLGHGVIPQTPVENVQALCELIRKESA
jgi:uroporphyrinogen decarboxylase